ncbi:13186_t:CDS:2 [Cetraspora pellucida]|uniref:13186_t:CDS:1 n=1 Tax=Cetraspora pellucida TaxID=1433469 RepID=A0A9N9AMC9_9GLOM|nr:13186_t:CDS:2 [Cetraspora pellucida]
MNFISFFPFADEFSCLVVEILIISSSLLFKSFAKDDLKVLLVVEKDGLEALLVVKKKDLVLLVVEENLAEWPYFRKFNTNLYILKRDISKDLENVGIDSSKESNNLKNINLDFLEEFDYNQENNNNFLEEFINNDLYSEHLLTIFLEHSNNLLDSHSEKNSDKLDESDESEDIDKLESDNSNKSEESDNLLNNKFFENIVDKTLDFERLSQNTNEFSPYFENLTAILLFC